MKKLFGNKTKVKILAAFGATFFTCQTIANASEGALHPPALPWVHNSYFSTFDHASIRRGFEVYRAVCANCHSLNSIAFRHLINECLTPEEAKQIAEASDIVDGPNDEGEMFKRPGKITDVLPPPYENDEMARFINGGSLPPDLSLMIKARPGGADYVYALLTGYREPPAGVVLKDGQHYNPYFPGGLLGMAQALTNGLVEYSDGTPATISQQAKDVTMFLSWAAEPEHDQRKRMGLKVLGLLALSIIPCLYWKRWMWSSVKSRKTVFFDTKH